MTSLMIKFSSRNHHGAGQVLTTQKPTKFQDEEIIIVVEIPDDGPSALYLHNREIYVKCVHIHEEVYGLLASEINCFWDMLMAHPEEQTYHQATLAKLRARKWFGIGRPKNKAKAS